MPFPLLRASGLQTIYLTASFTPLLDEKVEEVDILVLVQETTDRVQAENAQKQMRTEAEERAAESDAILSSIADGLLIYTPEKEIIRANPAGERLLQAILGRTRGNLAELWEFARTTTPEGAEIPYTDLPASRALQGQQVLGQLVAIHPPRGETIWISVSAGPILTPDGRLLGGVSTYTDITPLQTLREERERLLASLEERVAELDATITSIPDGVFIYSLTGEVVRVNPSTEDLLYLSEAERCDPLELRWENMHAQTAEGAPLPLHRVPTRRALEGEEVHGVDVIIERPGVGRRWFSVSAAPIRTRDGRVLGAVSTFTDVTERRAIEAALRESEEKFRTLAENAAAVIGIVQGTRFVYANPYMSRLSGYSEEEVLTTDISEMVTPAYRAMVMERARQRLAGDTSLPARYEFVMLTKDGRERWIDFTPTRTVYHGRPALIGIGFDVTERKQAEEAVRASEEKFRSLFEHMSEAVAIDEIIENAEGQPTDWVVKDVNPAYEAIYQIRREDAVEQRATALYAFALDQRSTFEHYGQMIERGTPLLVEVDDPRTQRHLLISAFSLGEAHRFATTTTDITARKHAEEERERLLAELDATLEAIADALIIADPSCHIVRVNAVAERLFGITAAMQELPLDEVLSLLCMESIEGVVIPVEESPIIKALHDEMVSGQLVVIHLKDHKILGLRQCRADPYSGWTATGRRVDGCRHHGVSPDAGTARCLRAHHLP